MRDNRKICGITLHHPNETLGPSLSEHPTKDPKKKKTGPSDCKQSCFVCVQPKPFSIFVWYNKPEDGDDHCCVDVSVDGRRARTLVLESGRENGVLMDHLLIRGKSQPFTFEDQQESIVGTIEAKFWRVMHYEGGEIIPDEGVPALAVLTLLCRDSKFLMTLPKRKQQEFSVLSTPLVKEEKRIHLSMIECSSPLRRFDDQENMDLNLPKPFKIMEDDLQSLDTEEQSQQADDQHEESPDVEQSLETEGSMEIEQSVEMTITRETSVISNDQNASLDALVQLAKASELISVKRRRVPLFTNGKSFYLTVDHSDTLQQLKSNIAKFTDQQVEFLTDDWITIDRLENHLLVKRIRNV